MFNPTKAKSDKAEKAAKQKAINDLRTWSMELVPEDLREGLIIDVSEVICGDPSCAPIDTVFTLVWEPSGKGLFSIAAPPSEVTREDLPEEFPVMTSPTPLPLISVSNNALSLCTNRIVKH